MQIAIKAFLYFTLLFLLLTDYVSENWSIQVYYLYLGLIYFDCKDHNIRSLVIIIAVVECIFYEIDYFTFIVSKYYLNTGPIAGDLILNCIILINMISLSLCVLYRQEIMFFFSKFLGVEAPTYMPNRGDYLIITSTRFCTFIYIIIFILNGYTVYQYNTAIDPQVILGLEQKLIEEGHTFIKLESGINVLRYLIVLSIVLPWSQQEKQKSRSIMSF